MTLPIERTNAVLNVERFLMDLTTPELLSYNTLIEQFETHYGKRIRWADE